MVKKKKKSNRATNQEHREAYEDFIRDKERAEADLLDKSSSDEKTLLEEFETQFSSNEPIRELFTGKNVKFKTQLSEEQRSAVSVLYHAYRLCLKYKIEFDGLKYVLDEYIDFGVSIDRKGRMEYVEAHKSQQLQNQMQQQQQSQINNLKY